MLTADIIHTMGQANASVNSGKTKERVKAVLKPASNKDKNAIDELAGLKRASINRAYTTGNISAKIAVAIAQVLNVDPFYLTGDSDEQGMYSDVTLNSFLTAKKYGKLIQQDETPARKPRGEASSTAPAAAVAPKAAVAKPKPAAKQKGAAKPKAAAAPKVTAARKAAAKPKAVVRDSKTVKKPTGKTPDISREEAAQLLDVLYIQARYSEGAQSILNRVKHLLTLGFYPGDMDNTPVN